MSRLKQTLIALDQAVNAAVGSGWADETYSAWCWRSRHQGTLRYRLIDALFFREPNHCRHSYEAEQERFHLPPEYRHPS